MARLRFLVLLLSRVSALPFVAAVGVKGDRQILTFGDMGAVFDQRQHGRRHLDVFVAAQRFALLPLEEGLANVLAEELGANRVDNLTQGNQYCKAQDPARPGSIEMIAGRHLR